MVRPFLDPEKKRAEQASHAPSQIAARVEERGRQGGGVRRFTWGRTSASGFQRGRDGREANRAAGCACLASEMEGIDLCFRLVNFMMSSASGDVSLLAFQIRWWVVRTQNSVCLLGPHSYGPRTVLYMGCTITALAFLSE